MALPPKMPLHAGAPGNSPMPKAASYLMRAEDRDQSDGDPTDGGTGGEPADEQTAPELRDAIQQLMDQYGTDKVQMAMDECAEGYKDAVTSDDDAVAAAAASATDLEPVEE